MILMFTAYLLASFFGLTFFVKNAQHLLRSNIADKVFHDPIQSGILNFLKLKDI